MSKQSKIVALALVLKLGSRLFTLESRGDRISRLERKERLKLRALRAVFIDRAANR